MIPEYNIASDASEVTPMLGSNKSKSSRKRRKEKRYVPKTPIKKKSRIAQLVEALAIYTLCVSLPTICYVAKGWFGTSKDELHSDDDSPLFMNDGSIMYLASKTPAGDLWSPYNHSRDDRLINLPAAIYHFLIRHMEQYIKRDALSDVQFIFSASVLLSLIRVVVVQMLVPRYLAPRRLAAMVKTKSTHLLSSSEYQFKKNDKLDSWGSDTTLSISGGNRDHNPTKKKRRASLKVHVNKFFVRTVDSVQRSLGHETRASLDSVDEIDAIPLFAAPRYATAIFRLLFCLVSCCWALLQFSSADFWPIWVGGQRTASTRNCWDLSGSLALKGASDLDSDFDHQNSALRYFFLSQASYQIHSICFHVLSMMLLVVYGGKNGILSARQSLKSYSLPMLEHTIYFVLTVATYIFSSLRRLGAISIFALELSSMMLQFLQICINAPESSPFRNDRLVKFVHRFLAVPSFIYCRFFIMPCIVQYSAAFESAMWLQQIEKAFQPGVGMAIYVFFNGMLLLAFGFNFEYLRRLLFHPFVMKLHEDPDMKYD